MNKIAIFISNYSIGNSPSIINLVNYLSTEFDLDIYLKQVELLNTDSLKKKNIKIFFLSALDFYILSYENFTFYRHYHPRKNMVYDVIKNSIFLLRNILNSVVFFLNGICGRRRESDYSYIICFDPPGFILFKKYFTFSKPIYYSLELYLKNDHAELNYPVKMMNDEREKIHEIGGLIIQSEEKEILFREDYNLSPKIPAFILPVTYEGNSVHEKSTFLRDLYGIKGDKKIALHLGGITEWFSPIELAISFSKLKNWVLFFQGYPNKKYIEKMRIVLEKSNINNVIISDKVYLTIDELNPVLQSCDIGIAWYNDLSIGFRTAGKSSGKIPMYMRFGLPIIAKKYPSTIESIEKPKCGICVDNFDEIESAVMKIDENYSEFSINAYDEYDRSYNFENYKKPLLRFLCQNK